MNYSKPKVTLEKYTLAESVMADISSIILEEDDPMYSEEDAGTSSVSSVTLNAFGEVFDFSKK